MLCLAVMRMGTCLPCSLEVMRMGTCLPCSLKSLVSSFLHYCLLPTAYCLSYCLIQRPVKALVESAAAGFVFGQDLSSIFRHLFCHGPGYNNNAVAVSDHNIAGAYQYPSY